MRLAAATLAATTDTALYTVPALTRATFSVNLCNRNAFPVTVRIALVVTTLGNTDYIEYDYPLEASESVERSGLMLGAAQILYVRASATGVSAVVWGTEEQI